MAKTNPDEIRNAQQAIDSAIKGSDPSRVVSSLSQSSDEDHVNHPIRNALLAKFQEAIFKNDTIVLKFVAEVMNGLKAKSDEGERLGKPKFYNPQRFQELMNPDNYQEDKITKNFWQALGSMFENLASITDKEYIQSLGQKHFNLDKETIKEINAYFAHEDALDVTKGGMDYKDYAAAIGDYRTKYPNDGTIEPCHYHKVFDVLSNPKTKKSFDSYTEQQKEIRSKRVSLADMLTPPSTPTDGIDRKSISSSSDKLKSRRSSASDILGKLLTPPQTPSDRTTTPKRNTGKFGIE